MGVQSQKAPYSNALVIRDGPQGVVRLPSGGFFLRKVGGIVLLARDPERGGRILGWSWAAKERVASAEHPLRRYEQDEKKKKPLTLPGSLIHPKIPIRRRAWLSVRSSSDGYDTICEDDWIPIHSHSTCHRNQSERGPSLFLP